jgi:SAM-dependent methyltransferase
VVKRCLIDSDVCAPILPGTMFPRKEDAFGKALLAFQNGERSAVAFEREDGYIDVAESMGQYFAKYRDWPEEEKAAMRLVRGRVLDIGCGAGRHCLYLQDRGFDVVGIDNSGLAVKVCRMRGVRKAKAMAATDVCSTRLRILGGRFDTVMMMGNNLGLLGSARRARWMLRRLHGFTNPGAVILGSTLDPYKTDKTEHKAFHARNRCRGRMGGQARIRVRHGLLRTPWFDYLFVSRRELRELLEGSGWTLEQAIEGSDDRYIAVLVRTD